MLGKTIKNTDKSPCFLYRKTLYGKQAAQTYFGRAGIGDLVNFYLRIDLAGLLDDRARFVRGDSVHPAAEGNELYQVDV